MSEVKAAAVAWYIKADDDKDSSIEAFQAGVVWRDKGLIARIHQLVVSGELSEEEAHGACKVLGYTPTEPLFKWVA
jgi:hypothetical protein